MIAAAREAAIIVSPPVARTSTCVGEARPASANHPRPRFV
jgi:hypothetical protein